MGPNAAARVHRPVRGGRGDFAAAVAKLSVPPGVDTVHVDDHSFTNIFGCRIAVDMNGTFDVAAEARARARRYGRQLSGCGFQRSRCMTCYAPAPASSSNGWEPDNREPPKRTLRQQLSFSKSR